MGEGGAGVGEGAETGLVRRTVGTERSREGEPGGGQVVSGRFICIAATFALTVPPSPGTPRRQSLFLRNTFGRFRPRATCATLRPTVPRCRTLPLHEVEMSQSPSEHHGRAAYHHESATRHHRAAENAYGSGDHKKAAHEAQCAAGHASLAKQHADLAATSHLEHHGMEPVAESDASPDRAVSSK